MKQIHYLIAACCVLFISCQQGTSYTNYYFDAVRGNDANMGTNPHEPFKSFTKLKELPLRPGDSILLKSGVVFTEKLLLTCTGDENNPIVLGKYGGSDLPHIKGDGSEESFAHIYNSQNIVIRDLEISNKGEQPIAGLKGLWVELYNYGEAKNITIDNLFVHDVFGSNIITEGGGIAICLQNGRDEDTISNRFNGLKIENCLIKESQRDGIKMKGYWIRSQWNPNLKVEIRNNVLDGVPGDGIVLSGCDGGLIEYNVMKNCPKTLPVTEACDGIWPWCSDNTLVQFNVVSDHKSMIDGYAYDSDWGCRNSVFQYNLSFNNDGGFMLIIGTDGWPADWCVNGNIGTIVKYNASINDGLRNYMTNAGNKEAYFSPVVHFTGFTQNTLLENNLFYMMPKPEPHIDKTFFHFTEHDRAYGKGDQFINNYFHVSEEAVAVKEELAKNNVYQGNKFTGRLITPSTGFERHEGVFDKNLWYNQGDKNWDILIGFLKDKTIPVGGKELKVLDILGYY